MCVCFCEAETVLCVCECCKALTVQSEHSGRGRGGDDSFSADKLWVCSASEAAASTYKCVCVVQVPHKQIKTQIGSSTEQ